MKFIYILYHIAFETKKEMLQFANASAGVKFVVSQIIGGEKAQKIIQAMDIQEGDILFLESVEHASICHLGRNERFILSTAEGLRLYLHKDQAESIMVSYLA